MPVKISFSAALLALATFSCVAQPAAPNSAAPRTAAPVFGGVLTPKKPVIQELLQNDIFTNVTEIILLKASANYFVGKFEITQEQYRKVMGSNPSQFGGDRNPVDSVSYNEALAFCAKLNEAERKEDMLPEGFTYTLPTQAQWEALAGSVPLDQAVTSVGANRSSPAPVGSLPPTGAGFHDLRGNVMEWCLDPTDKNFRVLRGACWRDWIEANLRLDFRHYSSGPDDRQNTYGFRVVLQKL